jgi:hypothetical protein
MRAIAGQAARNTGRLLHRVAHVALVLVMLGAVGIAALSWRLSRGPLDLPWLTRRLEAMANADDRSVHLLIGSAALSWEGFSRGRDHPLDIALSDVQAFSPTGEPVARIPRAAISLSVAAMFRGQAVPRSVEIEGMRLFGHRSADGVISLDASPAAPDDSAPPADQTAPSDSIAFADVLAALAQPRQSDAGEGGIWSQWQRVRIRDAALGIVDQQLGVTWRLARIELDITRQQRGGAQARGGADIMLAGQQARLSVQATIPRSAEGVGLAAQVTEIRPATIASAVPALAALALVDAPVVLTGAAKLAPDLALRSFEMHGVLGKGSLRLGQGVVPVLGATVDATGTPAKLEVTLANAQVAAREDGMRTTIHGRINASREGKRVKGELDLNLDQAEFADLPTLWPEGVGGAGARQWITTNITGGTARNGHVAASLQADDDLSNAEMTQLAGGIEGHDLTVHWLRPIPPIDHGQASIAFLTPDMFTITIQSGHQSPAANAGSAGIALQGGTVRLTGLAGPDQFADIDGDLAGPVSDLLLLLRHPRLRLLDRRPIDMRNPAGKFAGHISVAHLPLQDDLSIDDINVTASAHVTDLHLGAVAAGFDLDRGNVDLRAGNDGLKIGGNANVAGIPVQLQVEMDFRSGPASQVIQKVSVSGTVDAKQADSVGLATGGRMSGSADIQASLQARRDGRSDITVRADLRRTGLQFSQVNWKKPPDQPANADIAITLAGDKLQSINQLRMKGDGIDVDAQIAFAGGRPSVVRLQRLLLGAANDLHGEIRWPAQPGAPWIVTASGKSIDATTQLARKSGDAPKPADDQPGPPWQIDARMDRIVLGEGRSLANVVLRAESNGTIIRQAALTGRTVAAEPFELTIAAAPGGRSLSATAQDAGGLLRALGVVDDMQGGQMTLSGKYDDGRQDHPLSGTAEISDFRMSRAPALAKLLQAMTLYGLVAVIQGPGLGFQRLIAPYRMTGSRLELDDARAFNASLGMTAKGRFDTATGQCDIRGTIVPAYFFNNLLGNIPLLGRLFSPERGGGVFAATYAINGNCDDPSVSVNPLAALTPGFLRGLFGVFETPPGGRLPAQVPSDKNPQGSRN